MPGCIDNGAGAQTNTVDGREFNSWPPRNNTAWVTVFGRTNHLSISPSHSGQLNRLPSAGREMSTGQSALMLCGWGLKARWLIPLVDKRVGGR